MRLAAAERPIVDDGPHQAEDAAEIRERMTLDTRVPHPKSAAPVSLTFCDTDYPLQFVIADAASKRSRARHFRCIGGEMVLLGGAAATASVAVMHPINQGSWLLVLPVVLLMAAMITNISRQRRQDEDLWFDGRAVAETAKTASWRYMMAVPPFDGSDDHAETVLTRTLEESVAARSALAAQFGVPPGDVPPTITARMRHVRTMAGEERCRFYRSARVLDQAAWYGGKAAANARAAEVWSRFGVVSAGLALFAAAGATVAGRGGELVAVFTTLAAAALAWTQLGRHGELRQSYAMAAAELRGFADRLERGEGVDDCVVVVDEAELAISREHTMATAKRRRW